MKNFIASIYNKISLVYRRAVSNIAFVPSLMGLSGLILAIAVLYLNYSEVTLALSKSVGFLLVKGADNARMVLGTIIGGMISLTVFSFSMVMVVLNRASDSLSPRVLPQLVASKTHQTVLGFYMGTIVFSLVLIVNVNPGKSVPALGILLSMVFAIVSLALFIYFIHSISQNIQVDNILRQILQRTLKQLDTLQNKTEKRMGEDIPTGFENPTKVKAGQSGYCRLVNLEGLVPYLSRRNMSLYLPVYHGEFVVDGHTLAFLAGAPVEEADLARLAQHVYTANNGDDELEFHFGFRKISEIAVKALSPGINDPGTALKAVRYLTLLFVRHLALPRYQTYTDSDDLARAVKKVPDLDGLLQSHITPIRHYSGGSMEILNALIDFFEALFDEEDHAAKPVLTNHFRALVYTIDTDIENAWDRENLSVRIAQVSALSNEPKLGLSGGKP